MAVASSRGRTEPLRQWRERETSPERTRVWKEPKPRKVPVVYYLSRNGQLEHPHFMEVALSSADGLYLRDIIDRLDFLRGKGMANLYSWSSKRSYKNGFVWHDLSEDDLILPAHGHEYVLKGSELLQSISSSGSQDAAAVSLFASEKQLQIPKSVHEDLESLQIIRKRAPWSSFDLNEYKVYRTDLTAETGVKAADASTQTDDGRIRRRAAAAAASTDDGARTAILRADEADPPTTELEREEISPPPSSSSPETLETLIKADCRAVAAATVRPEDQDRAVGSYASGRLRASAVLMHLLSCGSINMRDHNGFSVSPSPPRRQHLPLRKERAAPRGGSDLCSRKVADGLMDGSAFASIGLEDKEYFSGSLIETKKKAGDHGADFPGLKRSSSYNADRSSKLELEEKEMEGVRAKCIPRKNKSMEKRESNALISRSTLGSKRINSEPQTE